MHARTLLFGLMFAAGLMLTAPASAQMGGPVSLEYTAYPTSRSQDLPENVEPAETRVQNIALSLGVPIQFKSSGTLLFPSFKYNALLLDRRPELDPQLNALHNPALQLVVLQKLSESWTGLAIVSGGLASDLKGDLTRDDAVFTGSLIASYAFSDDFSLGGGVTYDRRTGDLQPLPLVQLNWHLTERLRISGVVPANVIIVWRASEPITLGLSGGLQGNRYHLDEETWGIDEAEVAYSVIQAGPTIAYHVNRLLHLEVTGGWTIRRRAELLLRDETQDVSYLENNAFLSVRLRVGLSGWRSDKEAMDREAQAPTP